MLLTETIRVAFAALRANRLRSLLTMLGIVIGVGAVIAVIALGNGAQNSVRDRLAKLGTTILQINSQRVNQGGVASASFVKLTMLDVNSIRDRSPTVVGVNPQQDRNMQVVWKNKNTNVQITGTDPNFLQVRGFKMESGEMFTAADNAGRRRVAVLGGDAGQLLGFDDGSALIGEHIRIQGRMFTVIGVMARRGANGFGDGDEQILIPFNTGRFELFGTDRINDIWALAQSEDSLQAAMAQIQAAMRRSHRKLAGSPDDFTIRNQADFLTTLSETTQTFSMLLTGIAAVSLLVGGIGIMNIMLVSVTERTREIGIRKALGATRGNILLQFLTESVVLCVLGGALGIFFGMFAAAQMQRTMGWNTAVDFQSIVLAFGFASAIGLIFGVLPARRAALLDPIEALRYD
jgi:putative ABC transport system permease protein